MIKVVRVVKVVVRVVKSGQSGQSDHPSHIAILNRQPVTVGQYVTLHVASYE